MLSSADLYFRLSLALGEARLALCHADSYCRRSRLQTKLVLHHVCEVLLDHVWTNQQAIRVRLLASC